MARVVGYLGMEMMEDIGVDVVIQFCYIMVHLLLLRTKQRDITGLIASQDA